MIRTRILIVEDDESMQEFYRSFFQTVHKDEFDWRLARTGEEALHCLAKNPADILILDWCLPKMSGLDVLKRVRANPETRQMLVFMVTAMSNREDAVSALEMGADDYLHKPIYEDELLARLHSLARRKERPLAQSRVYEAENLLLDRNSEQLTIGGKRILLEPKEMDLLEIFLKRPNTIHNPRCLWETLWGYSSAHWKHTLIAVVSSLRGKLDAHWRKRLESHWGKGYLLMTKTSVLAD